jgi:copper transport protein
VLSLGFDWLHLVAGSLWLGGLIGLVVLWRAFPAGARVAGLAVVVPRFSNVAFVSVGWIIITGAGAAILHLPTVATLWTTSYGKAVLVKIVLLALAMPLGALNMLRTRPRLIRADPGAPHLLRRLVSCEVAIVASIVFAAAVLSSLPPPSKALASIGNASAHVGPGPVTRTVTRNGYTLAVRVNPNKAAVPNDFTVKLTRGGKPVQGADVVLTFAMLDMEMGNQAFHLTETSPGVYTHAAPALVMVGHWGLSFDVSTKQGNEFTVLVVDKANG